MGLLARVNTKKKASAENNGPYSDEAQSYYQQVGYEIY
jgi:hypothetical protein